MIIEIKNKIEWQKGLHERQEQDSKWFKLAEECKLTQREELLKQEEKIKKLKKVTRNEDQKSQIYLQNESPQYELCKIEGDKDKERNGNTGIQHTCIECVEHLTYNKNKICKCCYLNGLEWRVREDDIEQTQITMQKEDWQYNNNNQYFSDQSEQTEQTNESKNDYYYQRKPEKKRIVVRKERKKYPKWKGSLEIETLEQPTTKWSERTRRRLNRNNEWNIPDPPEVVIDERPIITTRRNRGTSNIIQQYTAPVINENPEEEESNEEENSHSEEDSEEGDNTQHLIWGTDSENEQPESSTQARRRRIRTQTPNEEEEEEEERPLEEGIFNENGDGLVPLHKGNSAITLNIEINGWRMQGIIDHNFRDSFVTEETATKCALMMNSNRIHDREQNLEGTYFPLPYKKETTREVDIRIATNITIQITEGLKIIKNLPWQSQSTENWKSRMFMVIGYDTIEELKIRIDLQKRYIMIPNEDFVQPTEKRYNVIKGLMYPDLTIQENQQLAIIEEAGYENKEKPKEKIETIREIDTD